ncbi:MAG: hypothetical protein LBC55_05155 [Desulfovibrio sp.]|nr:hypothetical protein [Desulfovibrio sp.]
MKICQLGNFSADEPDHFLGVRFFLQQVVVHDNRALAGIGDGSRAVLVVLNLNLAGRI